MVLDLGVSEYFKLLNVCRKVNLNKQDKSVDYVSDLDLL